MSRLIAIFFGAGLLRPAPGTWGSLVAIVLAMLIDRYLGFPLLVAACKRAAVLPLFHTSTRGSFMPCTSSTPG